MQWRNSVLMIMAAGSTMAAAPAWGWVNPGFETGSTAGWTTSQASAGGVAYLPNITVVTNGGAPHTAGTLCAIPTGCLNMVNTGNYAVQLFSGNGDANHADYAQIQQSDTVVAGQSCLCFWLAAVLSGHHYYLNQPYGSDSYVQADLLVGGATVFTQKYSFYDNLNQLVDDGASDTGGWDPLTTTPIQWRHLPWTQFCFDLSAYVGQVVTLRITSYDCDAGGHYAIAYLDDVTWSNCAPPQMALQKSVSPASTVAPGSTLTYTLNYQNNGAAADNDVVVCDTIPANSTFTGVVGSLPPIPAVSWTGTHAGDSICWYLGYVPAGASGSLSFTVRVNSCGVTINNQGTEVDALGGKLISNLVTNPVLGCTPTRTATPTRSPTPTRTPTRTATPTATPSDTATVTPTATPTDTPSDTRTVTLTATPTDTPSATRTATPTATVTPTATPSATPSATRTVTSTDTPSPTATPTWTPSATRTLTDTVTVTRTATPSDTVTPTDTPSLTATVTRSATPTVTFSSTATATLTRTPTPTLTSSPSPTDTRSATASETPSPSLTCTATATITPTFSATATFIPTLRVSLAVYNSAGELVVTLAQGILAVPGPNGGLVNGGVVDPDTGQALVVASYQGQAPITWNGTNAGGQMVGGGSYLVQATVTDPWGKVTSYSQAVQVIRTPMSIQLVVFNSAGERVRTLSSPVGMSIGSFALSSGVLVLGGGSGVKVQLGGGASAVWDGNNDLGQPVGPGLYTIQAIQWVAGQGDVLETRAVQVLSPKGPDLLSSLVAAPQPCPPQGPLRLAWPPVANAHLQWGLYNLAGELALQGRLDASVGSASLDLVPGALANGLYLLELRLEGAGLRPQQRILKLALMH